MTDAERMLQIRAYLTRTPEISTYSYIMSFLTSSHPPYTLWAFAAHYLVFSETISLTAPSRQKWLFISHLFSSKTTGYPRILHKMVLFSWQLSTILTVINYSGKAILFADDLSTHLSTNSQRPNIILQIIINTILSWSTKNGYRISTPKTNFIIFQKRKPNNPFPSLLMNTLLIPNYNTIKVLGVPDQQNILRK